MAHSHADAPATGDVTIRPIRLRDARALERELLDNRGWLRQVGGDQPARADRASTRGRASARLQANARAGLGLPFAIEYDGEFAGQLNVSAISYGSLSSATIGYWVAERFAGQGHHADRGRARHRPLLLPGRAAPHGDLHPARERAVAARGREARLPLRGAAAPLHPHQRRLARPLLLRAGRRRSCRRACCAAGRTTAFPRAPVSFRMPIALPPRWRGCSSASPPAAPYAAVTGCRRIVRNLDGSTLRRSLK